MLGRKSIKLTLCLALIAFAIIIPRVPGYCDKTQPEIEVPYEPTPPPVIQAMLSVANVGKGDVVYDLGCGDGRTVVMAVRKFGATRGVGVDLDPQRLQEAKERAKAYGVADKIRFVQGNIFDVDASKANVVFMYLLDHVNLMLRPKLFNELQPGTRCVAHAFHMDDWKADKIVQHPKARNKRISLWVIPAPVGGNWKWETKTPNDSIKSSMSLAQTFQRINGTVNFDGTRDVNVIDPFMDGRNISFTARVTYKGSNIEVKYRGVAEGDTIRGTQEWKGGPQSGKYVWLAKRDAANVYGTWEISAGTPRANIDGVLNIKRVGNRLAASYFVKNEGREEGLRHIYVWGNSVYFRVPLFGRESEAIFTGTLENTGAKGKVSSEGWGAEYNWTGRRSK